ncbi:hypothetical protein WOLCODRAFT_98736 [Wolfiporia cocos MD-104 SS10]|uniref:Methyltransferase domain-containing protein n=1 Tax=Wolfiporia cocos (strain MD-104) TaxID=742152 RepID=A0A2H3JDL2_WOLCO|nr:hypothetical protein WOLCODRAFT_98736 [Wolfiporia cocos MD-104 SS10]
MSTSSDSTLLAQICRFLCSDLANSLLLCHPNRLHCKEGASIPMRWTWWDWAASDENESKDGPREGSTNARWLLLLHYYNDPHSSIWQDRFASIPDELKALVDDARRLQIPRQTMQESSSCMHDGSRPQGLRMHGMSPKKAHEVMRMTEYVSDLLSSCGETQAIRHVVDVGAGQVRPSLVLHLRPFYVVVGSTAYLSRNLRDELGLHVLALDWSDVQTQGAARKDDMTKAKRKQTAMALNYEDSSCVGAGKQSYSHLPQIQKGTLTYKTLRITAESLTSVVDEWVANEAPNRACAMSGGFPDQTFLLFVALHACGSLTPSILRAVLARLKSADISRKRAPVAAVVVGCCYNLLEPKDFPLSETLSLSKSRLGVPGVALTSNHLQLAAQVPSQWLGSEDTLNAAKLAMRKVVWRALLERALQCPSWLQVSTARQEGGSDAKQPDEELRSAQPRRLGRLNDAAYADWDTFLARAKERLGSDLATACARDEQTERRLEVLHVLRCILGPVVESLILLDREQWLREQLEDTGMAVKLVNLFDQASGSGRNVAIVLHPRE